MNRQVCTRVKKDLREERDEWKAKYNDLEALQKEREWKGWESRNDLRIKLVIARNKVEALEKEKQELLEQLYALAFPSPTET